MLKRFFFTLILVLGLTNISMGADNGFYFGIKFVDSIQSTGSTSTGGLFGNQLDAGDYTQNTIGGGIFAGFDFAPANDLPLRAEIEYAIRTDSQTSWDFKNKYYDAANDFTINLDEIGLGGYGIKSTWNLQTIFFNLYWDFRNDTAFTPYIGAGAGIGIINSKYELEGPYADWDTTDIQTVFAWNVGAGCAYALTENLSIDLAYRFVGLSYFETEKTLTFGEWSQTQSLGMAPYANEFSLGVRYTF